ncbi:hypothetical protein [Peteryoungia algae]|uniref:Uncharacterized protein n=1 Tax=Peteryoungia algae TaxID=2919917 RepID=A0ABT0CW55_9HYPH|nr:hypothetical protein [Rhizobium sp. SSM4.3]MCJ8237400.1 hypothetical protein [Rhizobium sp. SSM4.3]
MTDAIPPDEIEITRTFWKMLEGSELWHIENIPEAPVAWLRKSLSADGLDINFNVKMRHHAGLEHQITYADFGLVIVYEDKATRIKFSAPYVVQAKRLYKTYKSAKTFGANDKFGASDDDQRLGLFNISQLIGKNFAKYMAFSPRLDKFDVNSQAAIRALHEANTGYIYTGTQFGLALAAELATHRRVQSSGNWMTPISPRIHTAAALHRNAFDANLPFGWFVIANICALLSQTSERIAPFHSAPGQLLEQPIGLNITSDPEDLGLRLALCEDTAVEKVASALSVIVKDFYYPPVATLVVEVKRSRQMELDLFPSEDMGPGPDDPISRFQV